jgi:hypothetical protein
MISLTGFLKGEKKIRQAISLLVHFSSIEGPKSITTPSVFLFVTGETKMKHYQDWHSPAM